MRFAPPTRIFLLALCTLAGGMPRGMALLNIDGTRNQVFVFGNDFVHDPLVRQRQAGVADVVEHRIGQRRMGARNKWPGTVADIADQRVSVIDFVRLLP